jgi:RNA polymerase sigma-70 factor (ECF subfamily)
VDQGDDAEIRSRCLAGDEKAYRELVQRYERQVFTLARRMVGSAEDAEDLTQETFVRMFKALDRYDPSRPFAAWLYTIASRLAIDHLRRRRVRPMAALPRDEEDDRPIEVEDTALRPDEVVAHAEEEDRVRLLIDSLPPHYRLVVLLRHQQDLSYEEIAAALHLPLGTVKARIHRARALLKERLEGGKGTR